MGFIKKFYKKIFSFLPLSKKPNKSYDFKNPSLFQLDQSFWTAFNKKASPVLRFFKKRWVFFTSLIIAFLLSDTLLIRSYRYLIPPKDIPISNQNKTAEKQKSTEFYARVWEKNIFHRGPIPLKREGENGD